MNKAGSKRKAEASGMAVPAKRSANLLVPEDVLQSMAASLNAATLALMDLPCGDIAARGRAVAVMADCKRRMHDLLGIKRRGVSVLAISDTIIDVFQFLPRKELDMLQVVCGRFNTIVEE